MIMIFLFLVYFEMFISMQTFFTLAHLELFVSELPELPPGCFKVPLLLQLLLLVSFPRLVASTALLLVEQHKSGNLKKKET